MTMKAVTMKCVKHCCLCRRWTVIATSTGCIAYMCSPSRNDFNMCCAADLVSWLRKLNSFLYAMLSTLYIYRILAWMRHPNIWTVIRTRTKKYCSLILPFWLTFCDFYYTRMFYSFVLYSFELYMHPCSLF